MKKKRNWNLKSKHILIIMVVVCVGLMLLTFAAKFPVQSVRTTAGYTIIPFQNGLNKVGNALDGFTEGFRSKKKLIEENKALQSKVDDLTAENSRLTQNVSELARLQELYQLDQQYNEYDKIAAEVIAKNSGNWYSTFTINRGSEDGILVDQNVIAGSGLVGIVTEVGAHWATVRSIIDDSSNVSAMVLSTSDRCIVSGDLSLMSDNQIRFGQMENNDNTVSVGDQIVTSYISDKYLQGILIGYVSEVTVDSNNLTRSGYITPAVDFKNLQEVLVITTTKADLVGSNQSE